MKINYFSKTGFAKITVLTLLTTALLTFTTAEDDFVMDELDLEEDLEVFDDGEVALWTASVHEDGIPNIQESFDVHELIKGKDEDDTVSGDGERIELGLVFSEGAEPVFGEEIRFNPGDGFLDDEEEYEELFIAPRLEDESFYTRAEDSSINTGDVFELNNRAEYTFNVGDTVELTSEESGDNEVQVEDEDTIYVSKPGREPEVFKVDRKPLELSNAVVVEDSGHGDGAVVNVTIENQGSADLQEPGKWNEDEIFEGFEEDDIMEVSVDGDKATLSVDMGERHSNDYEFQIGSVEAVEDELGNHLSERDAGASKVSDIRTYRPEINTFDLDQDGEVLVEDDTVTFTVEVDDDSGIDTDSSYIDTQGVGERDQINLVEDCISKCELEMTVDTEMEKDVDFELNVENTVVEGAVSETIEDVEVKGGRADIINIELHGDGAVESVKFEITEELNTDSFEKEPWKIATGEELSDSNISIIGDIEHNEDKWYEFNVDSDYDVSDASQFSVGYKPSGDNHLETGQGRRVNSVEAEKVSQDGDIEEDDYMKPEVREIHWREGLDRFAIEFTEPVNDLEIEDCKGCDGYEVAENQKNFVVVNYEDNIEGADSWNIDVEDLETAYDSDLDIGKVDFNDDESNSYLPILSSGLSDTGWDLVSLSESSSYVELTHESIENSFIYDSEDDRWDRTENLSAKGAVYIKSKDALVLDIDKVDSEEEIIVPETQTEINEGLNLVSPVTDEEFDSITRSAVNWFSELAEGSFVSDVISPKESQVNVDGDMDDFREDCWDDGDWEDDCGETLSDGFNAFEGYWINVEEN